MSPNLSSLVTLVTSLLALLDFPSMRKRPTLLPVDVVVCTDALQTPFSKSAQLPGPIFTCTYSTIKLIATITSLATVVTLVLAFATRIFRPVLTKQPEETRFVLAAPDRKSPSLPHTHHQTSQFSISDETTMTYTFTASNEP